MCVVGSSGEVSRHLARCLFSKFDSGSVLPVNFLSLNAACHSENEFKDSSFCITGSFDSNESGPTYPMTPVVLYETIMLYLGMDFKYFFRLLQA